MADRKQVCHAERMPPQQRKGDNHYDTEYERKEDSLRLRLFQPQKHLVMNVDPVDKS